MGPLSPRSTPGFDFRRVFPPRDKKCGFGHWGVEEVSLYRFSGGVEAAGRRGHMTGHSQALQAPDHPDRVDVVIFAENSFFENTGVKRGKNPTGGGMTSGQAKIKYTCFYGQTFVFSDLLEFFFESRTGCDTRWLLVRRLRPLATK